MIIPPESLASETLTSLLQDYITREGTDYGEIELTLEEKLAILRPQVMNANVLIIYDESSGSFTLRSANDV